jgi:ferrous iron transport protein A
MSDHPHSTDAPQMKILSDIAEGTHVQIMQVNAGLGLQTRLAAMRVLPRAKATVIRNMGRGPIILSVRGCRIALGRGLAHKILVA